VTYNDDYSTEANRQTVVSASPQNTTDAWDRLGWLWNALFYIAILISSVFVLIDGGPDAPLWIGLLLTALLVLWHWLGLRATFKGHGARNQHIHARFIVVLGDIVLWSVLLTISAAYYFVLFGFGLIFYLLPIRYAALATLSVLAGVMVDQVADRGAGVSLADPLIWILGLLGVSAVAMGLWISAIIGQSSRRRELINQLEQTQAELAASEHRRGILEERQRLAREIHDTLAQGFTSIVIHLEAADQALSGDVDTVKKHMDRARETARNSLDQARRVVHDLRPDLLEQFSLPDALQRLTERWSQATDIKATSTITGDLVPLHPNIEVTLLRAAQESLNNIHKHAQATRVQLTVSYMGDIIILDVKDNGIGFNNASRSPLTGGYGLRAMEERVKQYGGSVELESDPGEGTTVVVTIPLSD
jgi:signal transduction histidine kinase